MPSHAQELVRTSFDRGVVRITLDSPHNRNALSRALTEQLLTALTAAEAHEDARALLLTATGPVFCAGADLKEDPSNLLVRAQNIVDVFDKLGSFPLPVVVQLNGLVRAGGLGFLGAADVVIAPNDATFAFTEVRLGVVPAIIAVPLLPRLEPRASQRYFLSGETFDAAEAARIGLVSMAVAAEEVAAEVERVLDSFRAAAPSALRGTKAHLLARAGKPASKQGLIEASVLSSQYFAADDAREGIAAFREKRLPRWAAEFALDDTTRA